MKSYNYHQVLNQQQIEKFAPSLFDRSQISESDKELWDDE